MKNVKVGKIDMETNEDGLKVAVGAWNLKFDGAIELF